MSDETSIGAETSVDTSLPEEQEEVKLVYMAPNTEYFGFDEHPFVNAFLYAICGILIAIMLGILVAYFVFERMRKVESKKEE